VRVGAVDELPLSRDDAASATCQPACHGEAAQELAEGRNASFISLGTSMTTAIKAIQRVNLRSVRPREVLSGHIALARPAVASGCTV